LDRHPLRVPPPIHPTGTPSGTALYSEFGFVCCYALREAGRVLREPAICCGHGSHVAARAAGAANPRVKKSIPIDAAHDCRSGVQGSEDG
jgi:hypothetical protein